VVGRAYAMALIEFQTGPYLGEDYIVRYDDEYGRIKKYALTFMCLPAWNIDPLEAPLDVSDHQRHKGYREEMLIVETIKKVRLAARRDGKFIKQIAGELRLSKNTVRKVLRENVFKLHYERRIQLRPMLGAFVSSLGKRLEEDKNLPHRQHRSGKWLYEEIKREGYAGSYDNVQRYVRSWRREQQLLTTQAFVPLVFSPGEAFQFDWVLPGFPWVGERLW